MEEHKLILQRLYLRYNQGRGYVHTGLVGQDVCSALNMFFPDRDVSEVKYSVSKYYKLCMHRRLQCNEPLYHTH